MLKYKKVEIEELSFVSKTVQILENYIGFKLGHVFFKKIIHIMMFFCSG